MKLRQSKEKVIVRLKGGLGNQLFQYATGKALAIRNGVELVLDTETGFKRDTEYKRSYSLIPFNIIARIATPKERLEPFERWRRGFLKILSYRQPFHKRKYVVENGPFDNRLLCYDVKKSVYLDGYWQSPRYFEDVDGTICKDLQFKSPPKTEAQNWISYISSAAYSIALHVRIANYERHMELEYYYKAIALMKSYYPNAVFFCFSDDMKWCRDVFAHKYPNMEFVELSNPDAIEDFRIMTYCHHFVISNSSFSWWAAWIGRCNKENTVIITPDSQSWTNSECTLLASKTILNCSIIP